MEYRNNYKKLKTLGKKCLSVLVNQICISDTN